jgi:hypothetical protein
MKIRSRVPSQKFKDNFDAIFRKKPKSDEQKADETVKVVGSKVNPKRSSA